MDEDPRDAPKKHEEREEFTHNEVKDARWCFDTPGIVKEDCVGTLRYSFGVTGFERTVLLSCACGRVSLL